MKPVKMLGLAVVVAIALTAAVGPGTASAGGVLCEVQQNPCPEAAKWAKNKLMDFNLEAGTHATVTNLAGTVTYNSCPWSTLETKVIENPNIEKEVTTENASLLWGNGAELCDSPMTTIELGNLRITNIFGTWNGTVRADTEIKVTIKDALIGSCIYGIKTGAHIGELKEGQVVAGKTAPTLGIKVEAEKRPGDLCGAAWPANVRLTASYTMNTPVETTLVVSSS
jgi:hypothetical protein